MDTKLPRKYRPSQLSQVVGQKHIVATLTQASINNKFSQAYLFSGIKGCGKTSMGRILSKLMTCENQVKGESCGHCRACKTIPSNASLDVKELDGASRNKVEEARGIIDAAHYPPSELKRKIFIIDECHMLTKQANNAMLKLVEEPPSYLNFIFCTTEPRKMLDTILSRCQRFNFYHIPSKSIAKRLKMIAQQENINIDDKALFIIAKMARGSLRDAIGYLEQIGTVGMNKSIREDHIQKYFGIADRKGIHDMVLAIKNGNIPLLLDLINELVIAGAMCKDILFEITEVLRSVMILKTKKENGNELIDLPDFEIEELKKISEGIKLSQLLKMAHLFADIDKQLEFSINDRWIMEATLINCIAILRK
ncbi:MAG: DNA polymerase III subunit gamma/tau [bacterium]